MPDAQHAARNDDLRERLLKIHQLRKEHEALVQEQNRLCNELKNQMDFVHNHFDEELGVPLPEGPIVIRDGETTITVQFLEEWWERHPISAVRTHEALALDG